MKPPRLPRAKLDEKLAEQCLALGVETSGEL